MDGAFSAITSYRVGHHDGHVVVTWWSHGGHVHGGGVGWGDGEVVMQSRWNMTHHLSMQEAEPDIVPTLCKDSFPLPLIG